MQAINLLKRKIPRHYEMDVNSDRYRECLNDGVPFMANHRNEKHCCPECADEFNNLKKKIIRESIANRNDKLEQLIQNTKDQSEELQQNLRILDQLDIRQSGSSFNLEYLDSIGIDFSEFNGRGLLYNINPDLNCHFIQMGTYRLYRIEFSQLLIIKII
jgi:hypothetical protein